MRLHTRVMLVLAAMAAALGARAQQTAPAGQALEGLAAQNHMALAKDGKAIAASDFRVMAAPATGLRAWLHLGSGKLRLAVRVPRGTPGATPDPQGNGAWITAAGLDGLVPVAIKVSSNGTLATGSDPGGAIQQCNACTVIGGLNGLQPVALKVGADGTVATSGGGGAGNVNLPTSVDTGVVNASVITTTPATVGGHSVGSVVGDEFIYTPKLANTGAVTANVNGNGVDPVWGTGTNAGAAAPVMGPLTGAELGAGSSYLATWDGNELLLLGVAIGQAAAVQTPASPNYFSFGATGGISGANNANSYAATPNFTLISPYTNAATTNARNMLTFIGNGGTSTSCGGAATDCYTEMGYDFDNFFLINSGSSIAFENAGSGKTVTFGTSELEIQDNAFTQSLPLLLLSNPSNSHATDIAMQIQGLSNVVNFNLLDSGVLISNNATRTVVTTTATDTILAADCSQVVDYQGTVAVAVTLPTATTLAVPGCKLTLTNDAQAAADIVTVTPTTWTLSPGGGSTLSIAIGQSCDLHVDPAGLIWDYSCKGGVGNTAYNPLTVGVQGVTNGVINFQAAGAAATQINVNNSGSFEVGAAGDFAVAPGTGKVVVNAGLLTAGIGAVSVQAAPTAVTIGSGTSISATSLCSTTQCPAGDYDVTAYVEITTGCTTTGSYIVWLGWTDDGSAKNGSSTTTFFPFPLSGLGVLTTVGTLVPDAAGDYATAHFYLHTTGAANNSLGSINYGTTAGACGTGGPMVGTLYFDVARLR